MNVRNEQPKYAADSVGTRYYDKIHEDDGEVRVIVLRGPRHLCAYLGVPLSHPIAHIDYNKVPLHCHGGLTYGKAGDGDYLPARWWWYGWDYGHCNDYSTSEATEINECRSYVWTIDEVVAEAEDCLYDFGRILKLADACFRKGVTFEG